MGVYPNTLFHFTDKDGFHGILEGNFKLSFGQERIVGPWGEKNLAIPMVSFCDLRLSELRDHLKSYGPYGIGMTKSWALKQELNPVFYVNPEARIVRDIFHAVENMHLYEGELDPEVKEDYQKTRRGVLNMIRYMKIYEGTLYRRDKEPQPNFRFANEREWRWVPDVHHPLITSFYFIDDRTFDAEKKRQLNHAVETMRLHFGPDDIKYLVVAKDDERLGLIEFLKRVKGLNYTEDEIKRLSTRILTAEQVDEDM